MKFIALILFVLSFTSRVFNQVEFGYPSLDVPMSPDGNGMAGIDGTLSSDNPLAIFSNPAQLGISSINPALRVSALSSFHKPSDLLLDYWLLPGGGFTRNAVAAALGLNLNEYISSPARLSAGIGYEHSSFTMGTFRFINETPVEPEISTNEYSNNYSIGFGAEYYVKLGIGFTYKYIGGLNSVYFNEIFSRTIETNTSACDIGIMINIPVTEIIDKTVGYKPMISDNITPTIDIGTGYAERNIGGQVQNNGWIMDALLPRSALCGVSVAFGLEHKGVSDNLKIINCTLAHEAEDMLIVLIPEVNDSLGNEISPETYRYASGLGTIRFLQDVILGNGNNHATLRKGWQIDLCEALVIRGGSVVGHDIGYLTFGYGFRLSGLLKTLERISPAISSTGVVSFFMNHIDLRYDHSSNRFDDWYDLNNDATYDSWMIVLK
ncbi:MAG TPA: hypothetical protein VMW43_09655 [Bacteroidota bacterium]|nr:hypothetical protein [Bacteroidota bacterium]